MTGAPSSTAAATRREFDAILAWSVDRPGRSLRALVGFLGEIHAAGVDLYLHRKGIDTAMPGGKALPQIMGVFAEFERAMVRERVLAGLERARSQGKVLGRPARSRRPSAGPGTKVKASTGSPGTSASGARPCGGCWSKAL